MIRQGIISAMAAVLAATVALGSCGEDASDAPAPDCSAMVDKLATLCKQTPEDKTTSYNARCVLCSADGRDRWAACIDKAGSCSQTQDCSCLAK